LLDFQAHQFRGNMCPFHPRIILYQHRHCFFNFHPFVHGETFLSTISYNLTKEISLNFGRWCSSDRRQTGLVFDTRGIETKNSIDFWDDFTAETRPQSAPWCHLL